MPIGALQLYTEYVSLSAISTQTKLHLPHWFCFSPWFPSKPSVSTTLKLGLKTTAGVRVCWCTANLLTQPLAAMSVPFSNSCVVITAKQRYGAVIIRRSDKQSATTSTNSRALITGRYLRSWSKFTWLESRGTRLHWHDLVFNFMKAVFPGGGDNCSGRSSDWTNHFIRSSSSHV